MAIAIVYPNRDLNEWVTALNSIDPVLDVRIWPHVGDPREVLFAVAWKQPPGVLGQFPNLKCISSLGAGVEHLLNDPTLPAGVPLVRLVDDDLKQSMAEYVALGALERFRCFEEYRRLQEKGRWERVPPIPHISTVGVGIMGFGQIGRFVADKLAGLGFRVHGWNRGAKRAGPFRVFSGSGELDEFLSISDILVCLLPLTSETENILNARIFNRLPPRAYFINVGRGRHLVEEDLLAAIDSGRLSGALLDVFRQEPLPEGHPFWSHEKITVTPHIASLTNPISASPQIVENYRRVLNNEPPLNLVDLKTGY